MNSIAFDVENEKRFSSKIQKFFRRYQVSSILKKCNAYKEQGFSVVTLIQYLFCLVFRNRSMFLDMQSETEKAPEFRKDTVYRLKNSTYIDWKRFTTLLASRIISDTIAPLTSENRRNAFIMGDSIAYADRDCERLRGKYLRLTLNSRKSANVAKTAVARELACFLWGMINGRIA